MPQGNSTMKCAYCDGGEALAAFGIMIARLPASKVVLFKEQSHRGRVIVASTHHVSEIVELDDAQRDAFFADVNHVARVLHEVFHPDKINYGAYADAGRHLHFHLVPKYTDDPFEWGDVFAMDPDRVHLTEDEYRLMAESIASRL